MSQAYDLKVTPWQIRVQPMSQILEYSDLKAEVQPCFRIPALSRSIPFGWDMPSRKKSLRFDTRWPRSWFEGEDEAGY